MYCMKCGPEMTQQQAFCEACLAEMEKYPVKPGTVIQLPPRPETPVQRKQPRKRTLSPDEQLLQLKKRCRRLTIVLVLLALITAFLGFVASSAIYKLDIQRFWGQNYSAASAETTEPETIPMETE